MSAVESNPATTMSTDEGIDVALNADGLIGDDIVCRKCSYNLRGLSPEGRCPECGTSIGWSIHGDLLRFSDPVWVSHLANGALWMIVSVLLVFIGGQTSGVLGGLIGIDMLSTIVELLGSAIGLVGYWKLTIPDPGYGESRRLWDVRKMTRLLALSGFIGRLCSLANVTVFLLAAGPLLALIHVVQGSLWLAGVGASLLLFIFLRRLALRIPDYRLASQTQTVMSGLIVCFGVAIIGGLIVKVVLAPLSAAGIGGQGSGRVMMFGGCAVGIALLVFSIWWIVLLFLYRAALTKAADTALSTWMSHAAAQ